jgi:hypothetical protein
VVRAKPERSTKEALALGIDRRMSSYKTYYSGTADRITNLQLGVRAFSQMMSATAAFTALAASRTPAQFVARRDHRHRIR